ncbi:hypothetical protein Sipo8835_39250 [Streptomyces ipomoeae]|uniref:Uncharacterized protein n=1 Tax=Streptomyces ipomoeae TaxID=103232 RepID=A0AAE8VVR6_9ACTN|nr:hypothetical protein [Streptomyces ipomoeae]TQE19697.1 hypothetical protein Sipo8835_39250 [Streptomyces ipomoeae]
MNDDMPNPFLIPCGRYSTAEDDALMSTVDALAQLRQLAELVGCDLTEGMRQIEGERDTDLPRGPYTFENLVMEVTGQAYVMCDQVREAFGVPLPVYGPKAKPQMPDGDSPITA